MALKTTAERDLHYHMSLRVKPHVGQALEQLSRQLGVPKTSVIVQAIRELAKREGVPFVESADGPGAQSAG